MEDYGSTCEEGTESGDKDNLMTNQTSGIPNVQTEKKSKSRLLNLHTYMVVDIGGLFQV